MMIPTKTRIKVLKMEIKADIFPFEKAVNMAEVKIFKPTGRKLIANKLNPTRVK